MHATRLTLQRMPRYVMMSITDTLISHHASQWLLAIIRALHRLEWPFIAKLSCFLLYADQSRIQVGTERHLHLYSTHVLWVKRVVATTCIVVKLAFYIGTTVWQDGIDAGLHAWININLRNVLLPRLVIGRIWELRPHTTPAIDRLEISCFKGRPRYICSIIEISSISVAISTVCIDPGHLYFSIAHFWHVPIVQSLGALGLSSIRFEKLSD